MQVLWLTSWYPNKYNPYTGDFIQRHALAVAPFCSIHVIHAQLVPPSFQQQAVAIQTIQQLHFTETIVYIRQSTLTSPFSNFINQYLYIKYFKSAIHQYIQQQKEPNLVHVHVPVKAGKLALWMRQRYQIPYLLTEHYGIYNDYAPDAFHKRNFWFRNLTKKVIEQAAIFMPVSNNLGNAVNARVIKKPFEVVYNVVNTTVFKYQPTTKSDLFWLAHVSIMDYPKNPLGLLRGFAKAVAMNDTLRLRLIGTKRNDIVAYVNELNIADKVHFTDMIPHSEVVQWLHQSQAFLLFSNYENLPCSIAEALCCGLPVIATNVGGINEMVNDNNGILVPAGDEEALAKAILHVAHHSGIYQPTNIANNAAALFSYDVIGKQLVQLYQSVKLA